MATQNKGFRSNFVQLMLSSQQDSQDESVPKELSTLLPSISSQSNYSIKQPVNSYLNSLSDRFIIESSLKGAHYSTPQTLKQQEEEINDYESQINQNTSHMQPKIQQQNSVQQSPPSQQYVGGATSSLSNGQSNTPPTRYNIAQNPSFGIHSLQQSSSSPGNALSNSSTNSINSNINNNSTKGSGQINQLHDSIFNSNSTATSNTHDAMSISPSDVQIEQEEVKCNPNNQNPQFPNNATYSSSSCSAHATPGGSNTSNMSSCSSSSSSASNGAINGFFPCSKNSAFSKPDSTIRKPTNNFLSNNPDLNGYTKSIGSFQQGDNVSTDHSSNHKSKNVTSSVGQNISSFPSSSNLTHLSKILDNDDMMKSEGPLHNFTASTPAFQLEQTDQPLGSMNHPHSSNSQNNNHNHHRSQYNSHKSVINGMENVVGGSSNILSSILNSANGGENGKPLTFNPVNGFQSTSEYSGQGNNNRLIMEMGAHMLNQQQSHNSARSELSGDLQDHYFSNGNSNLLLMRGENNNDLLLGANGQVYPQSQLQNANKFFMCKLIAHLITTLSRIKDEEEILKYVNKIKESGRIQNKGKVDLYTLTHFRLIFFHLTRENIKQLNQHDILLHEQVFSEIIGGSQINQSNISMINNIKSSLIPLCKEYFSDNDELQKCILQQQWAKDSMAQGYLEWTQRIIKGIEKMSEGTYILRF